MELPIYSPKDLSKFDISAQNFQIYVSNIKSVEFFFSFFKKDKNF